MHANLPPTRQNYRHRPETWKTRQLKSSWNFYWWSFNEPLFPATLKLRFNCETFSQLFTSILLFLTSLQLFLFIFMSREFRWVNKYLLERLKPLRGGGIMCALLSLSFSRFSLLSRAVFTFIVSRNGKHLFTQRRLLIFQHEFSFFNAGTWFWHVLMI